MNTLDDLRSTLAGHADDLAHAHFDPRVTAVHARIARVRRQRRAALAGGLAAVVLAVVGVGLATTLPQHRAAQPAVAPDHLTVEGFDYSLGQTMTSDPGKRTLTVQLPKTDQRRAVMLVGTGLGAGYATLDESGQPVQRLLGSGSAPAFAIGSAAETLRVSLTDVPADGRATLAVYQRTAGAPVYRKQIDSRTLLNSATTTTSSATGSLSVTFRSTGGEVDIAPYCVVPAGTKVWMTVTMDGGFSSWGRCDEGATDEDAGAGGTAGVDLAAGRHTATLTLSATERGKPQAFPGTALGLGVYDGSDVLHLAGANLPRITTAYGLTWAPDQHPFRGTTLTPDTPVMPFLITATHGTTRLRMVDENGKDLGSTWFGGDSGGRGWGAAGVALPRSTYRIGLQYGSHTPHDGLVVLYRPVSQ